LTTDAASTPGSARADRQAIDGKRTFNFQDLQPCHLLQCLDYLIPLNERHLKMIVK
jgi:hypothetical protein